MLLLGVLRSDGMSLGSAVQYSVLCSVEQSSAVEYSVEEHGGTVVYSVEQTSAVSYSDSEGIVGKDL